MTDTPERALLERVLRLFDDRHSDNWFSHALEPIAEDIRALLAQPAPEGEMDALAAKVEKLHSLTGWVLASESDALREEIVSEIRALRPRTPLPRAEAEAMLQRYDESVVALQEGPMEALVPDAAEFDDARAALLRALTGEGM